MCEPRIRSLLFLLAILLTGQVNAETEYRLPSGEILQDPTRPQQIQSSRGQQRSEQDVSFTLNYILTKGQERRAMINGQKVVVGDQVSGAKVKKIEGDRVVLTYQGQIKELKLNEITGIKRN